MSGPATRLNRPTQSHPVPPDAIDLRRELPSVSPVPIRRPPVPGRPTTHLATVSGTPIAYDQQRPASLPFSGLQSAYGPSVSSVVGLRAAPAEEQRLSVRPFGEMRCLVERTTLAVRCIAAGRLAMSRHVASDLSEYAARGHCSAPTRVAAATATPQRMRPTSSATWSPCWPRRDQRSSSGESPLSRTRPS